MYMNKQDLASITMDFQAAEAERMAAGKNNSGLKFNQVKWEDYFSKRYNVTYAEAKKIAAKDVSP